MNGGDGFPRADGASPDAPGVTLALGGGGARGVAHLGVLEVLEEAGIPVRAVVGTSAGAIIAACYALEPGAKALTRRVLRYFESPEFARLGIHVPLHRPGASGSFQHLLGSFWRKRAIERLFRDPSIFPAQILRRLVESIVGPGEFSDARILLAITALDLRSGSEVRMTDGRLADAALASCSVSGFFPPVERNGALLVDFGLLNRVPSAVAREIGGGPVVGVDVGADLPPLGIVRTGFDVLLRTEEVGALFVNGRTHHEADVTVHPDVGERYWLDFTSLGQVVERGREAAWRRIDTIRSRLAAPAARRSG